MIMVMMIVIMKILIIMNLIQRMMIVVLAIMMSRSNNSLLLILMILILNQMINIPIQTLNSIILGYYYRFLSISIDAVQNTLGESQIILYIMTFQMYKSKLFCTSQIILYISNFF